MFIGREKSNSLSEVMLVCGSPKSNCRSLTEYAAETEKRIRKIQKTVVAIPIILIGIFISVPFGAV
jgi:hypothetical protein